MQTFNHKKNSKLIYVSEKEDLFRPKKLAFFVRIQISFKIFEIMKFIKI